MHVMNGRDLLTETMSASDKVRKYVRVSYGDELSNRLLKDLRNVANVLEKGLTDIVDSQVREVGTNKLLSGYTQDRNYISRETMNAMRNICYGVPSLVFHYTKVLCPGADVFLGDLTTDYCERHFRNLKQKDISLLGIRNSEATSDMMNAARAKAFAETGLRVRSRHSYTKIRRMKGIYKGNCGVAEDEVDTAVESSSAQQSSGKRKQNAKPRKRRAGTLLKGGGSLPQDSRAASYLGGPCDRFSIRR